MKMKKSTWLLLVLAIAAIFLVAGCAPTPPVPDEDENGEEPTPTPPPVDAAAPKVVKTMVSNVGAWGGRPDGVFKITIVFDEDIYSSCAENLGNWTVRVVNSQRGNRNILADDLFVEVVGNQINLYARVEEVGDPVITYALVALPAENGDVVLHFEHEDLEEAIDAAQNVVDAVEALGLSAAELAVFLPIVYGTEYADYVALVAALNAAKAADPDDEEAAEDALEALEDAYNTLGLEAIETGRTTPRFAGLICSEDDADDYEEVFGREVTTADVVTWSLSDNCAISDILGNSQCGYSGEACCVGPECEECVECDLTTGICK